jgi:hypothetical protein
MVIDEPVAERPSISAFHRAPLVALDEDVERAAIRVIS